MVGREDEGHLSFSVLALDLHIVIDHLHAELVGGEVLDIQVNRELVSVGPHLRDKQR